MRRARSFVLRTIRLVLMPAVFAAAFAGLTPITASASTCVSLVGNPPVSPGT
jgi:hypothetical protein